MGPRTLRSIRLRAEPSRPEPQGDLCRRADPGLRARGRRPVGIELTYIDKKTRDIIDDTCSGNWPTPSADAECDYYFVANIPELKRDFRGVTLKFETRKPLVADAARLLHLLRHPKAAWITARTPMPSVDVYPWHYDNIYGYLWDHQNTGSS